MKKKVNFFCILFFISIFFNVVFAFPNKSPKSNSVDSIIKRKKDVELFSLIKYRYNPILKYLVRVKSTYKNVVKANDQSKKQPSNVTLSGIGIIVEISDKNNNSIWAVLTASHLSQGDGGLKIQAYDDSFLKIVERESKPHRLADVDHDWELIEIEKPEFANNIDQSVHPKYKYYNEYSSQHFIANLGKGMHEGDSLSYIFLGKHEITLIDPHYIIENKLPLVPLGHLSLESMALGSLQLSFKTGEGFQNWQGDYVFDFVGSLGLSGMPVFNVSTNKLIGIIRGFHKYFPTTYVAGIDSIENKIDTFLDKNSQKNYVSDTRWVMHDQETIRVFKSDKPTLEKNFLNNYKNDFKNSKLEIVNSGGPDTADSGSNSQVNNINLYSNEFIPGYLDNGEPVLYYKIGEATVYAEPQAYQWILNKVNKSDLFKNMTLEKLSFPSVPARIVEIFRARVANSNKLWKKEKEHLQSFYNLSEENIEEFAYLHLTEPIDIPTVKAVTPRPFCFARYNDQSKKIEVALRNIPPNLTPQLIYQYGITIEMLKSEYRFFKLDLNGNFNSYFKSSGLSCQKPKITTGPFGMISLPSHFGSDFLIDPKGLFFLDYKQVDRIQLAVDKVKDVNLRYFDYFYDLKKYFYDPISLKEALSRQSGPTMALSVVGNSYLDSAYITVKHPTEKSIWTLTCVEGEENEFNNLIDNYSQHTDQWCSVNN